MSDSTPSGVHPYAPPVGHLAMHVDSRPEIVFSFEQPRKRMGNAFGVSFGVHLAFIFGFFVVLHFAPVPDAASFRNAVNKEIVWLSIPGPGGGGGGGGNKSPEPPAKAELPGRDKIAVPVAKPPKLKNPTTKDEPQPVQQMNIPAQLIASGEQTVPGVLDTIMASNGSQGSGTGNGAGTGTGTGVGEGQGSGFGPGYGGGTGGGAYRVGNGVQPPRLLRDVKPQYTSEAMRAKVQGEVVLECVVLPDGTVGKIDVIKSLDPTFGLDQEAVKAARQWKFVPGTRMGQPVPVLVQLVLTFTLR